MVSAFDRAMFGEGINRLQVELNANDHSIWGVAGEPIGADVLVDTNDTDDDPIVRAPVRYTLDWDWGRAKRHPDGGWTAVNELGYAVHVTEGKLVTRSLELMPCHVMPPPPAAAWFRRMFEPRAVFAGHGSLLPNESKISKSHEEDLANPGAKFLEERIVTDPEYCQAHYLLARPTGKGPGAAALEVAGSWKRQGTDVSTPFRITSSAAYGEIKDLVDRTSGEAVKSPIPGGVEVTVVRSLESLFRSVDFASADLENAGGEMLRSIVSDTQLIAGEKPTP